MSSRLHTFNEPEHLAGKVGIVCLTKSLPLLTKPLPLLTKPLPLLTKPLPLLTKPLPLLTKPVHRTCSSRQRSQKGSENCVAAGEAQVYRFS
jgi:hypothetical protein